MLTEVSSNDPQDRRGDVPARCGINAAGLKYRYSLRLANDAAVIDASTVVFVDCSGKFAPLAKRVDETDEGVISALIERGLVTGELATIYHVPLSAASKSLLIVGIGDAGRLSPEHFVRVANAVHEGLTNYQIKDALVLLQDLNVGEREESWQIQQLIMAFEAAAYRYRESDKRRLMISKRLESVTLTVTDTDSRNLEIGEAFAAAISTSRALSDTPPNVCTPAYLAEYAQSVAERFESVKTTVLDEADMGALGMNTILSVGRGSLQPSKFIEMRYSGPSAGNAAPLVLVGKGVTFDTGGTALKTRANMSAMKYDMCGAAVVMSTLQAVALLELPLNLVVLCACAENMPGGGATRPSDVVTSMSGKTVEIINPDAEGRLLLCDALTYAERFEPRAVIDVATLTGASVVALGRHYSALLSNNDQLLKQIIDAGQCVIDKAWQLPLSAEDDAQLDSDFADVANMGDGTAACVVAALFLSRFAGSYPWAHLDVSGSAKSGKENLTATGRPVALLLQFLLNQT